MTSLSTHSEHTIPLFLIANISYYPVLNAIVTIRSHCRQLEALASVNYGWCVSLIIKKAVIMSNNISKHISAIEQYQSHVCCSQSESRVNSVQGINSSKGKSSSKQNGEGAHTSFLTHSFQETGVMNLKWYNTLVKHFKSLLLYIQYQSYQ